MFLLKNEIASSVRKCDGFAMTEGWMRLLSPYGLAMTLQYEIATLLLVARNDRKVVLNRDLPEASK